LGGNCRIRVDAKINAKPAEGKNRNPFFRIEDTPSPLISEKANIQTPQIPSSNLYDFPTEAGKTYVITAE
jgi:alpha-L-fucosidase 2